MLCEISRVAWNSGAGTVERGDALTSDLRFTRGTTHDSEVVARAAAGALCGTCRHSTGAESIVRYVAHILQLIVFYAAGAALFFAVAKVR